MRGPWDPPVVDETLEPATTRTQVRAPAARRMLRPYRGRIVLAVVLLVAADRPACSPVRALVRYGIDDGLRDGDAGALNLAAGAVPRRRGRRRSCLGRLVDPAWSRRIGETFLRDLRARVFRHLMSLGDRLLRAGEDRPARVPHDRPTSTRSRSSSRSGLVDVRPERRCSSSARVIVIFVLSWQLALVHAGRRAAGRDRERAGSGGRRTARTSRCATASARTSPTLQEGLAGRARRAGVRPGARVHPPVPRDERGAVRRQPRDGRASRRGTSRSSSSPASPASR